MKSTFSKLFTDFFNSEKAGGFILIGCTILALLIANSSAGGPYLNFWHHQIGFEGEGLNLNHPIEVWVNDGLMAIFFLLVGLEIERELYIGELSSVRNALLPVCAAIGGMLIPALFHFLLNAGTATQPGFGIPMATDIAFALGILSLLGNKVPLALKVFLAAFAIIDDLGAILVIAVFYTKDFSFGYFGLAMAIWGFLLVLNRLKVHRIFIYIIPGIVLWYCMLQSGVHATITGILLAFALPFGNGDENSCSYRVQHFLHKPVAFIILPVFALANTGVVFIRGWNDQLISRNSLGIMFGLLIGKPIGILLFAYIAVKLKISQLGEDVGWKHILGASILGGIGFTMSIFITLLAFDNGEIVTGSKTAVLLSSLVAGLLGFIYLRLIVNNSVSGKRI
jgi:NhaA family Na+:H+ antiporter